VCMESGMMKQARSVGQLFVFVEGTSTKY
jgi:hypothetical protein